MDGASVISNRFPELASNRPLTIDLNLHAESVKSVLGRAPVKHRGIEAASSSSGSAAA
jgi:hypothetical protein